MCIMFLGILLSLVWYLYFCISKLWNMRILLKTSKMFWFGFDAIKYYASFRRVAFNFLFEILDFYSFFLIIVECSCSFLSGLWDRKQLLFPT